VGQTGPRRVTCTGPSHLEIPACRFTCVPPVRRRRSCVESRQATRLRAEAGSSNGIAPECLTGRRRGIEPGLKPRVRMRNRAFASTASAAAVTCCMGLASPQSSPRFHCGGRLGSRSSSASGADVLFARQGVARHRSRADRAGASGQRGRNSRIELHTAIFSEQPPY
jgi:hypothetical protein